METTKIQIKPITNEAEFAEANELIELLLECPEGSEEEKNTGGYYDIGERI